MRRKTLSSIFALCLSLLLIAGCGKNNQKGLTQPKRKLSKDNFLCVVCSGLSWGSDKGIFFNNLKRRLQDVDRVVVEAFEPTVNRLKTGIEAQSQEVFIKVMERCKNCKDIPIVLVGSCQGGLVLFNVAQELKDKGYNVKAMATLSTPWEGSLLLEKRDRVITLLNFPFIKGKIGDVKDKLKPFKKGGKGLDDMTPGSNFLQGLHEKMKKNTIPVLAIGTHCSMKNQASSVMMQLLFNQEKHDSLISLDSQQGNKIENPNFTTHTIKNVHHGWCPGIVSEHCISARESPVCLDKIQEFILKALEITPPG